MARGFGARESLGAAERDQRDVYSAYYAKAGAEMSDRLQALRREAEGLVSTVQMANNLRNNFFDAVKKGVAPEELEKQLKETIDALKNPKYKFEVDAPAPAKGGLPPLGAKGTIKEPDSLYPERRGSRADLAENKSTKEIKKMIVADFKSEEAKKMGFLGVKSATSDRSSMDLTVKTSLVLPDSMKDPARARQIYDRSTRFKVDPTAEEIKFVEDLEKMQELANRIADAYDVNRSDISTDYFDRRYMAFVTIADKDGKPF